MDTRREQATTHDQEPSQATTTDAADSAQAGDQAKAVQLSSLLIGEQYGGGSAPTEDVALPPTESNPYLTQLLRIGSRGAAVEYLQRGLNGGGAALTVDGAFGGKTHGAVAGFQRSKGLSVDGVVGQQTWGALGGGGKATDKKDNKDKPPTDKKDKPPANKKNKPPGTSGGAPGFDELCAKLTNPALQQSSLGPLLAALAQTIGVPPSAAAPAMALSEASGDTGFSPAYQAAEKKKAVDATIAAFHSSFQPYPAGPSYATAPGTHAEAHLRLVQRHAKPITDAEMTWLYHYTRILGLWTAIQAWEAATEAGEVLDPIRAQIITMALGQIGQVEAHVPSGEMRDVEGKVVNVRKGGDRFLEYLTLAAPSYVRTPKQRQDALDSSVTIGPEGGQRVPSWCGIFALWVQNTAGNGGGTWSSAPWLGPKYGPEKHKFRNPVDKSDPPQPGDIAYRANRSHHGTVLEVKGNTVTTVDGNTTGLSGIMLRTNSMDKWQGFVRATPKKESK